MVKTKDKQEERGKKKILIVHTQKEFAGKWKEIEPRCESNRIRLAKYGPDLENRMSQYGGSLLALASYTNMDLRKRVSGSLIPWRPNHGRNMRNESQ